MVYGRKPDNQEAPKKACPFLRGFLFGYGGNTLKELICHDCHCLIATLAVGSKVRKGSRHFCQACCEKKEAIPDFMSKLFGRGLSKGKG